MVYRSSPWRRRQSQSAEPGRPSKLDPHVVGDWSGLAGQDQTGLTVLGFEDIARRHVDLTGNDGAHARAAVSLSARVGHVDARREQHIDEGGWPWPRDAMALSVECHVSYGHGGHCWAAMADSGRERPMSGRDKPDRPVTGKESTLTGRDLLRSRS
jgi:hypothetical protein